MKRLLLSLVCLLLAGRATGPAAEKAAGEDGRLEAYFKSYLEDLFRHRPLDATRLGEHRFDHLLDDVSPEARAQWVQQVRKTLAELPRQINYRRLTRAGQIDFEIFQNHLKYSLWLADNTRPFEEDPRVYNDYTTDSVYLLFTQSTQPPAVNVKNAIARMKQIPRVVTAARRALGRPGSSSRRRSARTAEPSPSTSKASTSWPARRRSSAP
jgi:uncharacterized protein (DUF885 family)